MFEAFELSRFLNRKVALYRFAQGTLEKLYTTADQQLTIGGKTYVPARGISHTVPRETAGNPQKNQVTITAPFRLDAAAPDLPATQELGALFVPFSPTGRVLVTISTTHIGDPDQEVKVEWLGRVVGPKFNDSQVQLICDPSYRSARSSGQVRRIGRACDVPIYSQGLGLCNLIKAAHAVTATLTAVDGLQLSALAFASAPRSLAGGFVEWTRADDLVERRTIQAHTGDDITIDYAGPELEVGLDVVAFPGCAHNREACASYGNLPNYPGFANLPTQDPMPRSQAW